MFLTNNFALPALTIAELYQCRWQVELFFKWIKQHLRIKAFYGTSENAVQDPGLDRDQRLRAGGHRAANACGLDASLYEILQILSLTMFETTPLASIAYARSAERDFMPEFTNQLNLFES